MSEDVELRMDGIQERLEALEALTADKAPIEALEAKIERLEAMIIALQDGKRWQGER